MTGLHHDHLATGQDQGRAVRLALAVLAPIAVLTLVSMVLLWR